MKLNVFYGWWVLLASSALMVYGGGTFFYGLSVFVHPMVQELGWSMVLISGAFSLYRLEAGVAAPLAGYFLDRFGPRNLVRVGALIWGTGCIFLSRVDSVVTFYLAFLLISFGFSFTSGSAIGAPVIGKWFIKKRGLAIGIYIASAGLGGFLIPILSYFIMDYGWRKTLLFLGPMTWIYVLAFSFLLRATPESCGLLPDGVSVVPAQNASDSKPAVHVQETNYTLGQAFHTQAFWVLTVCFFLFQTTMGALFVHLIPHLITSGIESQTAALVLSVLTIASILGRIGFGWLGDIYPRKYLMILISFLQIASFLLLIQVRQAIQILPFLILYAPSYGGMLALKPAIVGEFFGRISFGTIYGVLQGISLFGGIIGPVAAGLVFDKTGNYGLAFILFAAGSLLSVILFLALKSPRPQEEYTN